MSKQRLAIGFTLGLILITSGFYIMSNKAETEQIKDKKKDFVLGAAIVQVYNQAMADLDFDKAIALTTGATKAEATATKAQVGTLDKTTIKNIHWGEAYYLTDELAIVQAEVTTQKEDKTDTFAYEYTLYGPNDDWRIAKITPWEREAPEGIAKNNEAALEVVKIVLTDIAGGNWEKASRQMTGSCKDEALKTLAIGQKPIKAEIEVLKSQVVLADEYSTWIEATYNTKDELTKDTRQLTMLFKLKYQDQKWLVANMDLLAY